MKREQLSYLVIGAGGTGGAIGSHMARAGHNVTFIARGRHLAAMRENGLIVSRPDCEFFIAPVNALTAEECVRKVETSRSFGRDVAPDVIFVCVKGYSIDEIVPFISFVAGPDTLVIPTEKVQGIVKEKIPYQRFTVIVVQKHFIQSRHRGHSRCGFQPYCRGQ